MLYALNLYSDIRQLLLNKTRKNNNKKEMKRNTIKNEFVKFPKPKCIHTHLN